MENDISYFVKMFKKLFGNEPDIISKAPARVNFIGEHIDYNGGLVLPIAINKHITTGIKKRKDKIFRFISSEYPEEYSGELSKCKVESAFWVNYCFGVIQELAKYFQIENGFDVLVESNIPSGSGLSSSAAIEVAFANALIESYSQKIDKLEIAKLCQRAENIFVGVNCGLMDQAASACCIEDHALLLDCSIPSYSHINFKLPDELSILVAHTGLPRKLSSSAYNQRRKECDNALNMINNLSGNKYNNLCEIPVSDFRDLETNLPEILNRRARHSISEQKRVRQICESFSMQDWNLIGDILNQSHYSLRDDFEVSCRELDELTGLLRKNKNVYGSRLTGAGFGGCTVSLINTNAFEELSEILNKHYYSKNNFKALFFTTAAKNGVETVFKI